MEAHEEDSAPYYCITEARCRLCQFALRDNELVYAAVGDDRVSGEFEFQQQRSIYDEDLNINIHMCLGDNCLSRIKATVCFHSRCYKVRSYTVTPAFLDATQYAFIAPPHEEQRRADYIRRALAQNLQKAAGWPSTLPLELWLMIAALLVQECAVVTTEERVHCGEAVGDSMLDLEQPVYATYVKVDGRYYVQRLLNAPETNGGKQAYLLLPTRTQKQGQDDVGHGKDLFVAEDHVGIRQVVFVSPHHRDEWCRCHPNIPGAWWRHIPRGAIFSNITIKTNGLIMRDIWANLETPLRGVSRVGWQVPVPFPPSPVDLLTLKTPPKNLRGLRMRFFDCNSPDIIGYSVATDGARILDILSHKQGQKPERRRYEDKVVNSSICHWMYMPVNQDEYITEIGRRTGHLILDTQVIGITLSTSRGRIVLFGLYGHESVGFERIAALPRSPCRVYFNDLEDIPGKRDISFFAFDQGPACHNMAKPGRSTMPELPRSISTPPYTQSNEVWLHTSCSMRSVVEVHLCVDHTSVYRPVIGLLFYYADGHGESIGQFRLDWAVEPITITELEKLYIYGKRTKKSWGYVSRITTQPPGSRTQSRWLEVNQAGTLEWWFSSRHSVLFYNNVRLN